MVAGPAPTTAQRCCDDSRIRIITPAAAATTPPEEAASAGVGATDAVRLEATSHTHAVEYSPTKTYCAMRMLSL